MKSRLATHHAWKKRRNGLLMLWRGTLAAVAPSKGVSGDSYLSPFAERNSNRTFGLGLGRVETAEWPLRAATMRIRREANCDLGLKPDQVSPRRKPGSSRLQRRHQRVDAHDVYDAGQVIGQHAFRQPREAISPATFGSVFIRKCVAPMRSRRWRRLRGFASSRCCTPDQRRGWARDRPVARFENRFGYRVHVADAGLKILRPSTYMT